MGLLLFSGIWFLIIGPVYSQNVTRYGNKGDSIKLSCPLTPPNVDGKTTWRGPLSATAYFYNDEKDPLIDGNRLSVVRNTVSSAYDLIISNITSGTDDGNYSCVVNTVPIQEYYITLKFNVAVQNVSLLPHDNPLPIKEGIVINVKCEVNKNAAPPPVITWYIKNNDKTSIIGRNTTNIDFEGSRTDNFKTLECQATNNKGTPKMASTLLNIEYPPSLNALLRQDILEGSDLSVNCSATPGNPIFTTFYWTRGANEKVIQNGSILQLTKIQRISSGIYKCTAENNYSDRTKGEDKEEMLINVQYPPVVNLPSKKDIIEGRDLSFNCTATPGNPNFTTFYWTKVDNQGFRQNRSTLQLYNINRNSSGTYKCTAENTYKKGEKGMHNQNMKVDVQYPPAVNTLFQQDIIEGTNFTFNCLATPGNPNSTKFYWTKVNDTAFTKNGSTIQFTKIHRTSSGIYRCTAENTYSNGEKGKDNDEMFVNVQYQPTIENKPQKVVNESEKVVLSRSISSNPLSNASWYNGAILLATQISTRTTEYSIDKASCEDTKTFSLEASNGIGKAVKVSVELIVNCKPNPDKKNITLGVTDTTGIEFSSTVVAYPEPLYELKYENGTINNHMMGSKIQNAINNFTFHFNQTVVNHGDYGTYHLKIFNDFGVETIFVNVLPQKSPESARNMTIQCEETSAKVQWISSFDGGDKQMFTVSVLSGMDQIIISNDIPDKGENTVHDIYVQNLQPSSKYTFYVSAQNRRGNSSTENITCITLNKDTGVSVSLIAGSAAAGGISLAIVVIIIIVILQRYRQKDKQAVKVQRLKEADESENTNDDGMKENILYVSAGPKVDEKPEAAVYAAVNKKAPESNNNANVYAEVNKDGHKIAEGALYSDVKPKRGLFKKDVSRKKDCNPKQKKGKKQKSKQDVADVYENSEDIAMSSRSDNVYSNSGQNVQNKEERGYKNKDGLLYVEVQFDAKTEKGNKTIHGEDEKTDYATVEFPMAASIHDESEKEKI